MQTFIIQYINPVITLLQAAITFSLAQAGHSIPARPLQHMEYSEVFSTIEESKCSFTPIEGVFLPQSVILMGSLQSFLCTSSFVAAHTYVAPTATFSLDISFVHHTTFLSTSIGYASRCGLYWYEFWDEMIIYYNIDKQVDVFSVHCIKRYVL